MGNLSSYYKTVNLEEGRPTVEHAMKRLTYEIHHAKSLKIEAIKLIHGYGSSGTGGKIRIRLRQYLEHLQSKGQIRFFVAGEDFSIFSDFTRQAFKICNHLRSDPDLERHNNGITIVIL